MIPYREAFDIHNDMQSVWRRGYTRRRMMLEFALYTLYEECGVNISQRKMNTIIQHCELLLDMGYTRHVQHFFRVLISIVNGD